MDITSDIQFRNFEGTVVLHDGLHPPLDRLTRTRVKKACDRATRNGNVNEDHVLMLGQSGAEFYEGETISVLNKSIGHFEGFEHTRYDEEHLGAVLLYEMETGEISPQVIYDAVGDIPEDLPPRLQFLENMNVETEEDPPDELLREIPAEEFTGDMNLGDFDEAWTYVTPIGDALIGRRGEDFQATLHCQDDYPYTLVGSKEAAQSFITAEVRSRYIEDQNEDEEPQESNIVTP